jgi:hypothetical protein
LLYINLQQVWFQKTCCKLMTSTSLLQLVDNLQQAGKSATCSKSVALLAVYTNIVKCSNFNVEGFL